MHPPFLQFWNCHQVWSKTLLLFAGCGTKEESKTPSKTDTAESQQKSETNNPETVSFFADGEYEVGTDIKPGSYYVLLTEFQAESEYDDVYFSYGTNLGIDDDNSDYEYENLKNIGKPYKITFQ